MCAAATGILLDGDAWDDNVEWRAPVREHSCGVVGAGSVENIEKALLVIKRAGIGGEISLGQQRRKQAIARAMAHMQRLRHSAEVSLDTAGKRGRDGKSVAVRGSSSRNRWHAAA